MSYNGSGTFVINTAGQPVVSGTVISSTAFNALTADLATGLSTAITKDGQTTPTANIPMGNNKITGLAVGTAATDAANLSQVQSTTAKLINSISGTDTITGTMSPNLGAYATGQMFYFIAAGDNTGAVTLNIDSLGAKAVTRDGSVALAASDLKSGEVVVVVYDGTRFQVVSQLNSAGDARFANVSITSALNVGGVATVTGGSVLNGGVVINEPGADADTRIEGDTDANLFFADASTDRIGVGTSSPATKLDVNGITQSRGNLYGGTSNTTANVLAYANVANGGAGFSQFLFANTSTETRGYLTYTHASDALLIGTVGATKATLDSSGNLGLGVTPSAWGSIFKAVQVGTGGSIFGRASANQDVCQVGANVFWDGSNWKYIASLAATRYEQASGTHAWHIAASGTAGNAITFTQAMALDASGNLLVGSTSSSAVANKNVDVNGTGDAAFTVRVGGTTYAYLYATASTALVGSPANIPFLFYTNGSERARITSGGSLLVGTNSDFAFSGTTFINSSTANCIFANTTSGAGTGFLLFQGRSGAANVNTAGTTVFSVTDNGNVTNTNNSYGAISDEKLKQDIVDATSQWDDIKGLRVRKFRYKAAPAAPLQIGLIAQEAETVSPGLVEEIFDQEEVEVVDESGNVKKEARIAETSTKSVKYSVLYMKAVKALQEAMSRIETLEAKVAALEAK